MPNITPSPTLIPLDLRAAAPFIGVQPRMVGGLIRQGLLAGTRTSPRGRYRTTMDAVQRYLSGQSPVAFPTAQSVQPATATNP